MAEQTRRELLEAAWDKIEEKDDDVATVDDDSLGRGKTDPVRPVDDTTDGTSSPNDGVDLEGGEDDSTLAKEKKTEKEPKKPAKDATQIKEEQAAATVDGKGEPGRPAEQIADKAPMAWKAGAREHWAKLPPDVRAEINRRELHIRQTLSQTAGVRQFAQEFAQTIQPFAHLIRAQNSTPIAAVKNLMSTAAGLMQGNPQQKAAIVAEIMQNYGVDVLALDKYLEHNWDVNAGRIKGGNGQRTEAPPAWAQPLFAMQQQIQETMTAQQQRVQMEADEKITAMESQPFFDDLRDDIADIMEISANRGRSMTIQQAYEKAIQLSPEISTIMTNRRKAEELKSGGKNISRARRAASSISGGPSGKAAGNRGEGPKTRREQLREAWDNAES